MLQLAKTQALGLPVENWCNPALLILPSPHCHGPRRSKRDGSLRKLESETTTRAGFSGFTIPFPDPAPILIQRRSCFSIVNQTPEDRGHRDERIFMAF
jgi:hypothetical protein